MMASDSSRQELGLVPLVTDIARFISNQPPPPASSPTPQQTVIDNNPAARALLSLLPQRTPVSANGPPGKQDLLGDGPVIGPKVTIRCCEGYENNIYIGTSEGSILWFTLAQSSTSSDPYALRHSHSLFPKRPIDEMLLFSEIGKLLVLSESTLHFLNLPDLSPVPSGLISPIRGVVTITYDETPSYENAEKNEVTLCIVKRKSIGLFRLGGRLFSIKEIPLPELFTHASLSSNSLFLSTALSYSLLTLSRSSMTEIIPVSQSPTPLNFKVKPNISVISPQEFLLTSCNNEESTMGLFISGEGDPVRGTVGWESHPKSIVYLPPESLSENEEEVSGIGGEIYSLLRSGKIVVHSLDTLEVIQEIDLKTSSSTGGSIGTGRALRRAAGSGIWVPQGERDTMLSKVRIPLLRPPSSSQTQPHQHPQPTQDLSPQPIADTDSLGSPPQLSPPIDTYEPEGGSGLTPPSSPPTVATITLPPTPSDYSIQSPLTPTGNAPLSAPTRSSILMHTSSALYTLQPTSSSLSIASSLLLTSGTSSLSAALGLLEDDTSARYIYHQALIGNLKECAFTEETARWVREAGVDFRLVLRLFGDLGNSGEDKEGKKKDGLAWEDDVEVEFGLKDEWGVDGGLWDIEDLIDKNLNKNYHPHISPSISEHETTVELKSVLLAQAKEMLRIILVTEKKRRKGRRTIDIDEAKDLAIDVLIDDALFNLSTTIEQYSSVLSDPSIHLDILEVLPAIPVEWPLSPLNSYLVRSVRKDVHGKHETIILKALALGENFAVQDEYYTAISSIPSTTLRAPTPPPDSVSALPPENEKSIMELDEKDRSQIGDTDEVVTEKVPFGTEDHSDSEAHEISLA